MDNINVGNISLLLKDMLLLSIFNVELFHYVSKSVSASDMFPTVLASVSYV